MPSLPPLYFWILLACAVVYATAALVEAIAQATMAIAARRVRSDVRRSLERISGSIIAAREMVRRASGEPAEQAASPRWADLMNKRPRP